MVLNRQAVVELLEEIESRTLVEIRGREYKIVPPPDMTAMIESVSNSLKCHEVHVYYALQYAARRGFVKVVWDDMENDIISVFDLTPDGHDYLSEIRGEKAL